MASVRLPKSAFAAIQGLVKLAETDFNELVTSLVQTPPTLSHEDFVTAAISRTPNLDPSLAEMILKELLGMLVAIPESGLTPDQFATEISDAALELASSEFPFTNENRDLLKDRLARAFGAKGLLITAKARDVLSDTDKTFQSARVLTDLRPIFDEEAKEICSAVVLHNLRIRYYENNETRDIYLSLEPADVESLVDALKRAKKKGALLEASVTTTLISMLK